MRIRKKVALALSLALLVINLSSCHRIIQPTCADIARANFSFLEESVQVRTELDLMNDTVVAYYNTVVDTFRKDALWKGKATVYYQDTYFSQDCTSMCDGTQSAKQWRGKWAKADTGSPVTQCQEWLRKIEAGACLYDKVPITETVSGNEVQVYSIVIQESSIDWDVLCDADFDSLFGGESLLGNIQEAEVTLLIDTQTLLIRQIQIAATGDTWLQAKITLAASDIKPQIQWDGELIEEAYLGEEWTILGSAQDADNAQTD